MHAMIANNLHLLKDKRGFNKNIPHEGPHYFRDCHPSQIRAAILGVFYAAMFSAFLAVGWVLFVILQKKYIH